MKSFFARYQQDLCEQVWEELYTLGPTVRNADVYADAEAVATETMRRVRYNIEAIIPRLEELGYQFGYEWTWGSPMTSSFWVERQPARTTSPAPDIAAQIERFEAQVGLLPLSLKAFYREVGGVNFVGSHPAWERLLDPQNTLGMEAAAKLDPLFVWNFTEDSVEDWSSSPKEVSYHAILAPDRYFKYDISGSGPYWMEVPNAAADGMLHDETCYNLS